MLWWYPGVAHRRCLSCRRNHIEQKHGRDHQAAEPCALPADASVQLACQVMRDRRTWFWELL
jgi:hypothetical protein